MTILGKARYLARAVRGKSYPDTLAVYAANQQTIDFIKTTQCRSLAEIGIYRGQTSLEFARYLDGAGSLHLYDFQDVVDRVVSSIRAAGYANVVGFGSSYKLRDSYNWQLAKVMETNHGPMYDYIFIDGAHTWAIDALTALLCDRLLKPGGYIDFDDYDWTLLHSPSMNPVDFPLTAKLYTDEQIAARQVAMIVDLLIKRDPRYSEVIPNKIYQKVR